MCKDKIRSEKSGKWVSVGDGSVPTYGKHGSEFILLLEYKKYYGHAHLCGQEIVVAIWDSVTESFYEKKTHMRIADEDIIEWYKEDELCESGIVKAESGERLQ